MAIRGSRGQVQEETFYFTHKVLEREAHISHRAMGRTTGWAEAGDRWGGVGDTPAFHGKGKAGQGKWFRIGYFESFFGVP